MFVSSVRTVENAVLGKEDNIRGRSILKHFKSEA